MDRMSAMRQSPALACLVMGACIYVPNPDKQGAEDDVGVDVRHLERGGEVGDAAVEEEFLGLERSAGGLHLEQVGIGLAGRVVMAARGILREGRLGLPGSGRGQDPDAIPARGAGPASPGLPGCARRGSPARRSPCGDRCASSCRARSAAWTRPRPPPRPPARRTPPRWTRRSGRRDASFHTAFRQACGSGSAPAAGSRRRAGCRSAGRRRMRGRARARRRDPRPGLPAPPGCRSPTTPSRPWRPRQ